MGMRNECQLGARGGAPTCPTCGLSAGQSDQCQRAAGAESEGREVRLSASTALSGHGVLSLRRVCRLSNCDTTVTLHKCAQSRALITECRSPLQQKQVSTYTHSDRLPEVTRRGPPEEALAVVLDSCFVL